LTISKTTATGIALAKRAERASEEPMLIKGRWIPKIDGAERVQNQMTTSLGKRRDLVLDRSFRRIRNLPRFPPTSGSRSHSSLPSHHCCPIPQINDIVHHKRIVTRTLLNSCLTTQLFLALAKDVRRETWSIGAEKCFRRFTSTSALSSVDSGQGFSEDCKE
jgi:hypothetical protein